MSALQREQRREVRKYKRIHVRYGHPAPAHRADAMRITSRGFFLSTNEIVYAVGSPIAIEITGPTESWVIRGIVRHAFKVHPTLAIYTRPGMGVEITDAPAPCRAYLASL